MDDTVSLKFNCECNEPIKIENDKAIYSCQRCNKPIDVIKLNKSAEENKLLKLQLAELNQANVNLFNKNEELEKENKNRYERIENDFIKIRKLQIEKDSWENKFFNSKKTIETVINENDKLIESYNSKAKDIKELQEQLEVKDKQIQEKTLVGEQLLGLIKKDGEYVQKLNKQLNELTDERNKLEEQLEIKEILNQDLVKKYEILKDKLTLLDHTLQSNIELQDEIKALEEEIKAYDINMSEMVKKYEQLEQVNKELQSEFMNNFQVKLVHKVKNYLPKGKVNVIIETGELG